MDQGRRAKKIFECKPEGSRRMGRPRLRWMEDVEKDLWETKVKMWPQKAVERGEWASVCNEAKAVGRPDSQGGNKLRIFSLSCYFNFVRLSHGICISTCSC